MRRHLLHLKLKRNKGLDIQRIIASQHKMVTLTKEAKAVNSERAAQNINRNGHRGSNISAMGGLQLSSEMALPLSRNQMSG